MSISKCLFCVKMYFCYNSLFSTDDGCINFLSSKDVPENHLWNTPSQSIPEKISWLNDFSDVVLTEFSQQPTTNKEINSAIFRILEKRKLKSTIQTKFPHLNIQNKELEKLVF